MKMPLSAKIEAEIARVEQRVNEAHGGDATIEDLVREMLAMGWTPPFPLPNAE